jgi:beta-carotene 15,15'-dioxygenase
MRLSQSSKSLSAVRSTVDHRPIAGGQNVARLSAFLVLTAVLLILNAQSAVLASGAATVIATGLILLAGIPHGTLDIEIAATRFGQSTVRGKLAITTAYVGGAATMALCWWTTPVTALIFFLVISILHFGADWREDIDPFLGAMIGWAIISLPALSHSSEVASIFALLTHDQDEGAVTALLACTAAPAVMGSLVFLASAMARRDFSAVVHVTCCLTTALFLPPLIAFALYFCVLHSPRHLIDALSDAGEITSFKKTMIAGAVFALSAGLGVLLYTRIDVSALDLGVIRTGFILLSILTVPHFGLELMIARSRQRSPAVSSGRAAIL